MPSDRKQFNVRMSEDTAAKVERLLPVVNAAVVVELSQAQFFALAVAALAEKYGLDAPKVADKTEEATALKKAAKRKK